jgi:hypothetical protein
VRWLGAGLTLAVAVGLIIAGTGGAIAFGAPANWAWVAVVAVLMAATASSAIFYMVRGEPARAAALACAIGLAGHAALVGGLAPSLHGLWLSQRLAKAVRADRLMLAAGPATVAGYAEPSLVFALGAPTTLGSAEDAADAIAFGRAAIVEQKQDQAFRAAIADGPTSAHVAATVTGLDYSTGHRQVLRLYEPVAADTGPRS